jgi:perosamine synthetase
MLPIYRPVLGEEELQAVKEVFESGWLGLGPKTKEFEDKFAQYFDMPYAIGMNSCTAALYLALEVLGIKEGDEVISPSLTFVATNHAILINKATPVFADVYEDTLTINPDDIARKITPKTKAIMVMHYGGHPCDMDPIMAIAKDKNLLVIEDNAHACGALYKGTKTGTIGDISAFSFHAVKNLTTGEGGMILTRDKKIDSRLRILRWVGINKETWQRVKTEGYSWEYNIEEVGYKYHLSDVASAIGLVQLKKFEKGNERRREIAKRYLDEWKNLDWLKLPVEKDYVKSVWHLFVVKVENREDFIAYLAKNGIGSGVHYLPNHHYEMYKKYSADVPITERVWKNIISLPIFPAMTEEDIEKVIQTVKNYNGGK